MRLHDLDVSGNCYKVRLFASIANMAVETAAVDFAGGAHRRCALRDANPLGPVADTGGRPARHP